MAEIMSTHAQLLSLGLLASLGGAGQAAESPFSTGSNLGLQIAVRVISDEPPVDQNQPPADEAEAESSPVPAPPLEDSAEQTGEDAPSPQASADTAPPQGDLPEEPNLSDQEGDLATFRTELHLPEDAGLSGPEEENQDLAGQQGAGEAENPGLGGDWERDPELAGQGTLEEEREGSLARAEAILNRVDQILLDARAEARRAQQEQSGGGGEDGSMPGADLSAEEMQGNAGEGDAEQEPGRGGIAEGQIPGNVPTGKTRPSHGYDEDEDIVTRQVCDLAKQEEDPEVRKHLEEKCESLKKG